MAANNIFFDISNANLSITPVALPPVAWTTFTAGKSASGVMLKWTTVNEGSSVFEVERSADNIHFTTIGQVAAGAQQYNFTDVQPAEGINYYRIKQLDEDSVYRYSAILPVDLNDANMLIVLYPNPATTMANIKLKQSIANVVVTLTDVSGKMVYATTVSAIAAGQVLEVPVARLAAGVYILHVKWDGGKASQQLLVD
jgi:hypothetical protein